MPRHFIRTSACDDNMAFHVLDYDLVSGYSIVVFEKDQAMEDQQLKRKFEIVGTETVKSD
jgi:hypothetical protein